MGQPFFSSASSFFFFKSRSSAIFVSADFLREQMAPLGILRHRAPMRMRKIEKMERDPRYYDIL